MDFQRTVTLGNVLSAGTVLVAISIGWATMDGRTNQAMQSVKELDIRVSTFDTWTNNLERDMNQERVAQTRLLVEMQKDISYLRAAMDEMRRPVNNGTLR